MACEFRIESLVHDNAQRALLFEMDMALMRWRSQHGETPDLVALTGQYHKLLRMRAST